MIGTQQILIFHICDLDESKSKQIIADNILSQVYSTDESKSESVIVHESFTEEIKSESVHKIINTNKGKDAIHETDYKEPSFTDNPVRNEPS